MPSSNHGALEDSSSDGSSSRGTSSRSRSSGSSSTSSRSQSRTVTSDDDVVMHDASTAPTMPATGACARKGPTAALAPTTPGVNFMALLANNDVITPGMTYDQADAAFANAPAWTMVAPRRRKEMYMIYVKQIVDPLAVEGAAAVVSMLPSPVEGGTATSSKNPPETATSSSNPPATVVATPPLHMPDAAPDGDSEQEDGFLSPIHDIVAYTDETLHTEKNRQLRVRGRLGRGTGVIEPEEITTFKNAIKDQAFFTAGHSVAIGSVANALADHVRKIPTRATIGEARKQADIADMCRFLRILQFTLLVPTPSMANEEDDVEGAVDSRDRMLLFEKVFSAGTSTSFTVGAEQRTTFIPASNTVFQHHTHYTMPKEDYDSLMDAVETAVMCANAAGKGSVGRAVLGNTMTKEIFFKGMDAAFSTHQGFMTWWTTTTGETAPPNERIIRIFSSVAWGFFAWIDRPISHNLEKYNPERSGVARHFRVPPEGRFITDDLLAKVGLKHRHAAQAAKQLDLMVKITGACAIPGHVVRNVTGMLLPTGIGRGRAAERGAKRGHTLTNANAVPLNRPGYVDADERTLRTHQQQEPGIDHRRRMENAKKFETRNPHLRGLTRPVKRHVIAEGKPATRHTGPISPAKKHTRTLGALAKARDIVVSDDSVDEDGEHKPKRSGAAVELKTTSGEGVARQCGRGIFQGKPLVIGALVRADSTSRHTLFALSEPNPTTKRRTWILREFWITPGGALCYYDPSSANPIVCQVDTDELRTSCINKRPIPPGTAPNWAFCLSLSASYATEWDPQHVADYLVYQAESSAELLRFRDAMSLQYNGSMYASRPADDAMDDGPSPRWGFNGPKTRSWQPEHTLLATRNADGARCTAMAYGGSSPRPFICRIGGYDRLYPDIVDHVDCPCLDPSEASSDDEAMEDVSDESSPYFGFTSRNLCCKFHRDRIYVDTGDHDDCVCIVVPSTASLKDVGVPPKGRKVLPEESSESA